MYFIFSGNLSNIFDAHLQWYCQFFKIQHSNFYTILGEEIVVSCKSEGKLFDKSEVDQFIL